MATQHILQVSELTKKVRFILESELNTVWLCGEISNFVAARSGHWYLSLKDSKSQVKCAMFKGNNRTVRITPRNGQQVLVRARVSLYEPRGDFQLIIEQMDDAGAGLLQQQFEALKLKLTREGLFNQSYKQPLPKTIKKVGVVTSPTGAAIKDIISVLKRRNSAIEVIVYPALVQGEQAAADVSAAIAISNQRNECDVLIVGRGGGSIEDLWCFNEEPVVRAIFNSNVPTISAVGHEIDTTLADYAADFRAPTPSAAAEVVSGDVNAILDNITTLRQRMENAIKRQLVKDNRRLTVAKARFNQVHPAQQLTTQQQRADELVLRLNTAMQRELAKRQIKPEQLHQRLLNNPTFNRVKTNKVRLQDFDERLKNSALNLLKNKQTRFAQTIEQLHLVSPLATIARGYSVTRNEQQSIVRSVDDVKVGEAITVQISNGELAAQITQIQNKAN